MSNFSRSNIESLINSKSELYVIKPGFPTTFGFIPRFTSVKTQKIDVTFLKTYEMVSRSFLFQNSVKKLPLFKENPLLTDIYVKVLLGYSSYF